MNTWNFDNNNWLRWHDLHAPGVPLIYLHGLGCASSSDYPRVVTSHEYLPHRSWLVDLPGAGFSDKPASLHYGSCAQAALLRTWIGDHQVALFGHSAGAFIALKLAALMPSSVERLILCAPGLNEYGVSFLSEIVAMSESAFIDTGFSQLLTRLEDSGGNEAWLGPFQASSPQAVYQWAVSALEDNAGPWLELLSTISAVKGVILPDAATSEEIARYKRAGCRVELVVNSGHMMAYDNPDALAAAISRLRD